MGGGGGGEKANMHSRDTVRGAVAYCAARTPLGQVIRGLIWPTDASRSHTLEWSMKNDVHFY